MFTSGLGLSTPNAENSSARVSGVERESRQPPFWPAEEPTELEIRQVRELYGLEKVPQVQELQELEKEDYNGFFGPIIGGFIFYLIKKALVLLILFLLFILIGPIIEEKLIDMIFEDACFGFPGEDCS